MSLINDALKRTQDNTRSNQPPRLDEIELRPIEPATSPPPSSSGGAGRLIIGIVLALVVVGCLALFVVYKAVQGRQVVEARTAGEQGVPEAVLAEAAAGEPAATGALVESEPVVEPQATNAIAVEPPEPERPEFLLKTIVQHPARPSAMVNNRIVFVGDRVAGYHVVAIGKDEVTLRLDDDEVTVSLP